MNLKMRLILALLAIILSNAMVSAKLTIAYAYNCDGTPLQRIGAQFRQSMVDIYGEEKAREYAFSRQNKIELNIVHFGNGTQLILNGMRNNSTDGDMLKLKKVIDHMAVKGDTLCLPMSEPFPPGLYYLNETLTNQTERRLFVGNVHQKNLILVRLYIGFWFFDLEQVYGHEKEKRELHDKWDSIRAQKQAGKNVDKEERDFHNRVFDLLMKSDRELLAQPLPPTAKVLDNFSYEYDKDAPVKIIHEVKK